MEDEDIVVPTGEDTTLSAAGVLDFLPEELLWTMWVRLSEQLGFNHICLYAPGIDKDPDAHITGVTFSMDEEYVNRIMEMIDGDGVKNIYKDGGEDVHKPN